MGAQKDTKIEEYITTVCSLIKNKDIHHDIKLELEDHLEILREEFITAGASEEEASDKTIAHMGEALVVGKQLNAIHKAKLDLKILISVIAFSVFGLMAMYIIQANMLILKGRDMQIFQKTLIFYGIGTVVMLSLYFFDYRKLLPYSKYIYIGTSLLLTFTVFFGTPVNGRKVLFINDISIDFIDVSLLFLVVALAGILQDWNWKSSKSYLLGLIIMALPGCLLITNGVSTLLIYSIGCLGLLLASKLKLYLSLLPVIAIPTFFGLFIISAPYRISRLLAFLHPQYDPKGTGYIYLQLKDAINSSGFLGNNSTDIQLKIPELHTDFIFTYLTYSFGWLAASIIIILIMTFILRMFHIANTTKYYYGRLLSTSLVAILSTQFTLSILGNLGISPLFGVSVPFMSFGGTHLIMDMASAGLILSIYRRKNLSSDILTSNAS